MRAGLIGPLAAALAVAMLAHHWSAAEDRRHRRTLAHLAQLQALLAADHELVTTATTEFAPRDVSPRSPTRLSADGVRRTIPVLARLAREPRALSISSAYREASPDNPLTPHVDESRTPLVLDGWGNPIVYAPAGGLWIRTGILEEGGEADAALLLAPDGLAFWASAGPDVDFRATSDNVYSFDAVDRRLE